MDDHRKAQLLSELVTGLSQSELAAVTRPLWSNSAEAREHRDHLGELSWLVEGLQAASDRMLAPEETRSRHDQGYELRLILAKLGSDPVGRCVQLLGLPVPCDTAVIAIRTLRRTGLPGARDALKRLLLDGHIKDSLVFIAQTNLGLMGDPDAVEYLVRLMREGGQGSVGATVELAGLGHGDAAGRLGKRLESEQDPKVHSHILWLMETLILEFPPAEPHLSPLMTHARAATV